MNARYKAAFALAFLLLVYTLYTILLQIGGSTIGLIPQLFYAFLVGSAASSVVSFMMDRGKGLASIVSRPKMLLAILVIGLINNALTQLSLGIGTLGTNPSIGGIVYRSWVIMVILLIPLTLRQKVRRVQILATLIGFLGLYLVLTGGTLFNFNLTQAPFMGFLLISALCSAVVTLIMSKYTFNVYGAVVLFNLVSFLLLTLLATATHTSLSVSFPPSATFAVLFLGIFGFGIGSSLYYYAIKVLGPQLVGNAILAVPFLTIVLSALIVDTPIKRYYLIAAVLITSGVLFQRYYSSAPKRITSRKALDNMWVFDVTGVFANNKSPEIWSHIEGDNKAFAIRVDSLRFEEGLCNSIFSKKGCLVFTNRHPHKEVKRDEIEAIKSMMKLKGRDMAVIGLGDPKNLEEAFDEFVSSQAKTGSPIGSS